jgi:hypothetical protein
MTVGVALGGREISICFEKYFGNASKKYAIIFCGANFV